MLIGIGQLMHGTQVPPVLSKLKKSLTKVKMTTLRQAKREIDAAMKDRSKMIRSETNKRYYVRAKKVLALNKPKEREPRSTLSNIFDKLF